MRKNQARDARGRFTKEPITTKMVIVDRTQQLREAIVRALQEPLEKAAEAVRKQSAKSIKYVKKKKDSSAPGTPPHTHSQSEKRSLPRTIKILYADKTSARIGTRHFVAKLHEFGGRRGGKKPAVYPERPYLRPALEKVQKDFPQFFKRLKVRT